MMMMIDIYAYAYKYTYMCIMFIIYRNGWHISIQQQLQDKMHRDANPEHNSPSVQRVAIMLQPNHNKIPITGKTSALDTTNQYVACTEAQYDHNTG